MLTVTLNGQIFLIMFLEPPSVGNVFFDFLKLKKKLNCFFFAHFEGLK